MLPADEIQLWKDFCQGNEKSLYQLYQLYHGELIRYGWSFCNDPEVIRDYINRTIVDLWNKRFSLPDVQHPKAFILTCFRNKLLQRKQGKSTLKIVPLDATLLPGALHEASCEETLIELQDFQSLRVRMQQMMNLLSDRQRQILTLRFMEEQSYEEIAQRLDISVRTVYNSIHESIKQLKQAAGTRQLKDTRKFF
ncbi:RNA polymerase sigma factor [Flavihumibacter petaseus]|uniref:Putative RNA polymerase ECF-type sigma factor n=1 Tax=Flavihumibacter petaseus NBRC 106054 TaxID=1220578 RepID=A0A0E9MUU2_9BACT|nr:RNA polymerase sigma factor [Flavihumibacter petaseus]GAO41349.1 putative RNA polymerase ECF-type sigma factor [Flavihumibacter petaseus NBRC 106054]